MFPIGQIVGGAIVAFLLGLLIDWMIFRRTSLSRRLRIVLSTVVAVLIAVLLYGFGNADGGPWNAGNAPVAYGIGGVIAGGIRLWRAYAKGELGAADTAH